MNVNFNPSKEINTDKLFNGQEPSINFLHQKGQKDTTKAINSFSIYIGKMLIGYVQVLSQISKEFKSYHFHKPYVQIFIALDEVFIVSEIGAKILNAFLEKHIFNSFYYALLVLDITNFAKLKMVKQAGFEHLKLKNNKVLMVSRKKEIRLCAVDIIALETAFKECWLNNDSLWIFGSRTDLNTKGGDIDLYIETDVTDINDAFTRKIKFMDRLISSLGEQKIDLVLNMLRFAKDLPIYTVAKNEGIKII